MRLDLPVQGVLRRDCRSEDVTVVTVYSCAMICPAHPRGAARERLPLEAFCTFRWSIAARPSRLYPT